VSTAERKKKTMKTTSQNIEGARKQIRTVEQQNTEALSAAAPAPTVAAASTDKKDTLSAQCGINWYSRRRDAGTFWTHCQTCGQLLHYTDEKSATPQVCALPNRNLCHKTFAAEPLTQFSRFALSLGDSRPPQTPALGPHASPDPAASPL